MALSKMDGLKPRLLQDFIIPHLEEGTFMDKLCWVDRQNKTFRISWKHQSSSKFSAEDSCVFQHWAMAKGLWDPNDDRCNTKAKQRLRAALLKLKTVKCISKDPESRTYKIITNRDEDTYNNSVSNGHYLPEGNPFLGYNLNGGMDSLEDYFDELQTERLIQHILSTPTSLTKETAFCDISNTHLFHNYA